MKTIYTASIAVLLLSCSPAAAGNLAAVGLDDPVVTPPAQCRIVFGLLPCNEAGHVRRPSDDDSELAIGTVIHEDCPGGCGDEPNDEAGDEPRDEPGGQNPGNDKPVGGSPFDGERGEEPSGVEK